MTNVKLTKTDQMILNSYIPVCSGLAKYLSSACEVVLHSLEDFQKSVICIYNGEHTGRKVGAPITDLALEMLDKIEKSHEDTMVYFSRNKKGEPLKSTTIAIRGENDKIIGLICMNLYLNVPLYSFIDTFMPQIEKNEEYTQSSEEMIISSYNAIKEEVMMDHSVMISNKNKVIVERLYEKGIFNLKDSIQIIERISGLSKNTVYLHIRNYKKKISE